MDNDDHIRNPQRGDSWNTSIGRIVYLKFEPASGLMARCDRTSQVRISC